MADLSITAANVKKLSTSGQLTAIAGVALTAGQTMYLDSSNLAQLANASTSATTAAVGGVVLNNAAAGQPVSYLQPGNDITIGATVAPGVPYFQSANNGGICPFGDLTTGMRTLLIGIGKNTTDITLICAGSSNQAVHA